MLLVGVAGGTQLPIAIFLQTTEVAQWSSVMKTLGRNPVTGTAILEDPRGSSAPSSTVSDAEITDFHLTAAAEVDIKYSITMPW